MTDNAKHTRNRIFFGAPGTGKSYTLNIDKESLLKDGGEYERVTFHPDYSYANFVGTYKPVMVSNQSSNQLDEETKNIISVLLDQNKSAQTKYDELKEIFTNNNDVSRLPLLIGLCSDEKFVPTNKKGAALENYGTERNHGVALRKYVTLRTEQEKSGDIAYAYVPGPFMRIYVKAKKNPNKPYLLIIEEINRANVAAVFGDVFQLLDRADGGESEYPIQASEDIKNYLAKELGGKPDDYPEISIPENMYIWATMNSADQGVFPMDTAFKRRWDFTYLGIDDSEGGIENIVVNIAKAKQSVKWNELRKAINDFLAEEKINEDKQLGPYFIARNIVVPAGGKDIDSKRFCDAFKNKVLMYLFDDAAKQKRSKLFDGIEDEKDRNRYSKICKAFDKKGVKIFPERIWGKEGVIDTTDDQVSNEKITPEAE